MEKSHNYPQMPPQMADASGSAFGTTAPPSYEQATTGVAVTTFPPVQVLPTPNASNLSGNAPQPQNTQMGWVGGATNTPYVGITVGSGPIPVNAPSSYPSQQQQMHQPMMQQPVVIIQQQAILPLGPDRSYVMCPLCHVQGMTRIHREPSAKTHLIAALLCILGFWCCVCLPYCADSCMNTNHYCANCHKFLGTYSDSL